MTDIALEPAGPLPQFTLDSNGRETIWTDWRMRQLEQDWIDGLTCTQIAYRLGCGITRNAVIGKITRAGINDRHPRQKNPNSQRRMRHVSPEQIAAREARKAMRIMRWKPRVEFPPVEIPEVLEMLPCSLAELSNRRCRWPVGDPGTPEFHFCGATPRESSPYCCTHHQLAYVRPPAKRKDSRSVPFLQHRWNP